ncbi:MAG: (Fe-S)-binding protein [Pseudomonadota bacterium]
MSGFERSIFWLLLAMTLGLAGHRIGFYVGGIRRGRGRLPADRIWARLKTFFLYVPGQWPNIAHFTVKDLAGPGHLLIFWGALILALNYFFLLFIGEGFSLSGALRQSVAGHALLVLSDVFAPLLILALLAAAIRRSVFKPNRLGPEFDAGLFWALTLAGLLLVGSYFCVEVLRIHLGLSQFRPPLTGVLADWLASVSISHRQLTGLFRLTFWIQYGLILTLIVYGTYSHHRHPLFSPVNIFFRSFAPIGTITAVDFNTALRFGASRPEEFTRKQLLDGFACTHCGRCQESCPASQTGKPLSPKQLLLDINRYLLTGGAGHSEEDPSAPPFGIELETLLSCTTCGACIEVCPVFNRPLDSLIALRQNRVYEGVLDPGHGTTLRRIALDANPWGVRWHRRAQNMNLPLARTDEHYDCIYWLGCAAAFDDRTRRIADAVAAILKRAGVRFAILGTEEKCCGDAARRIGDEGLFQQLATGNIRRLNGYDFDFVLTHCPHCLNALRNDYRPLGASFDVRHHSSVIADMLRTGALSLHPATPKIMYHDPCYLGRYHHIYEAPRQVLQALGGKVIEFARNRAESVCCGAGGGHMWKESESAHRMSVARIDQALGMNPEIIAGACPYCLLMLEEALGIVQPKHRVTVYDIAEIVQMYLH